MARKNENYSTQQIFKNTVQWCYKYYFSAPPPPPPPGELKQKVSGLIGEKEATGILEQVELLHDRYLVPTSRGYLQLDHTEVLKIATGTEYYPEIEITVLGQKAQDGRSSLIC